MAALLAGHFLFATVLSASPLLHHHLHHDAGSADHFCIVTIFASGGCDTPGEMLALAPFGPEIFWDNFAPKSDGVESIFLVGAVFEHAPPVLLS